jgi:UDP-N-acetyl-D-mannosaminuronate dehydrogenase
VDAFWDRTKTGHCIPLLPFYIGQASANIALDLVLLVIPIFPIRRLNITSSQKIAVTGIFFLGIL